MNEGKVAVGVALTWIPPIVEVVAPGWSLWTIFGAGVMALGTYLTISGASED